MEAEEAFKEQEEQMGGTETPESLFFPSQNILNETWAIAVTPACLSLCILSSRKAAFLFSLHLPKVCTLCVELREFCLLGRGNLQKASGDKRGCPQCAHIEVNILKNLKLFMNLKANLSTLTAALWVWCHLHWNISHQMCELCIFQCKPL